MKKHYGNRQNMTEVFAAFAVPQLFLGLTFQLFLGSIFKRLLAKSSCSS